MNQLIKSQKLQERQQEVLTMLRRVMHRYEQQGRLTNDHYLSVKAKYNYIVLGGGTNTLLVGERFEGVVISTVNVRQIKFDENNSDELLLNLFLV